MSKEFLTSKIKEVLGATFPVDTKINYAEGKDDETGLAFRVRRVGLNEKECGVGVAWGDDYFDWGDGPWTKIEELDDEDFQIYCEQMDLESLVIVEL